jgi:hypothetical protein
LKVCVDVGYLRWGFLEPSSSLAAHGDPGPVLDSVPGEGMYEDFGSVPLFYPSEWSLLCSFVVFGTKGQEEKIAFLYTLD